ncbi:YhcN/YlaJ family sporulation lipoprotein [Alteribacillus sp. HJP-4]|uniref:YhcN/YlaJ family sporulation lipoprotein n=1 Tax=Alteribacillus sp. HJP-4 TaxID=2775394 RepID=UPI0035CCD7C8
MKKMTAALALVLFAGGCAVDNSENKGDLGAEYGPEHPLDFVQNDTNGDEEISKKNLFGFKRHAENEAELDREMSAHDVIDRQRTAEGISSILVQSPDVKEAGVLITNEYALVAYETASENRDEAAEHVKQMTEAMVPYFYETVITDNPSMIEDLEAFYGTEARSKENHVALEKTVDDMRNATEQPVTDKEKTGSM